MASLRTRLSLATLALIACIVALFYATGRYMVVQTVREAEAEIMQIRLDVQRSVTRELLDLHQLAQHLAQDLAVQAPPDPNKVAPPDVAAVQRFRTLSDRHQLSLVLLRGRNDGVIQLFRHGDTQPDGIESGAPDVLRDYLLPNSPLLRPQDVTSACAGLLVLEGKMVLVAAAAVPEGAAEDLLLIGRNLGDQPLQQRISHWHQDFDLQVMVRPKPRIPQRNAFVSQKRLPAIFGPSRNFVPGGAWHVGRDAFETTVPLHDLHGDTVGAVSITLPGSFRAMASDLLDKLLWMVCGVGMVITLLAFYGLSRAVIAPLRQMAHQIIDMAQHRPREARLGWSRKDEFGELARTLDALLDRMEEDAEKIRARDREAQALFAAVPDAFCVFGTDGILRSFSCGPQTTRRIAERLKVGETIASTGVSAEVVEAFAAVLAQGVRDRASLSLIFPGTPPEQDLYVECRTARLDDDRVLAVLRDITGEHQTRRQMVAMEGKLLQLQRHEALGHLVGGIAHDFNNLLNVIQSSLEKHWQSGKAGTNPEEDADLKAIAQSARQATELIRQLQVYAGISDMAFERINLNNLLSNTWALLRASVPHHIELELDRAPHLPDIVADATQMIQVVSNLLLNAAEAIGSNPGNIQMKTRLVRSAELRNEGLAQSRELRADWYVALTIRDNGRGIAPAQLNRIIEPFFSTKGEGRGLGLATVAGILESHDAVLSVTSLLGKGSSFHVFFPVPPEVQDAAPATEAADARTPGHRRAEDPLCVLLVEDDSRIRSILRLLLESLGCEVLDASQEAEARVLIQRHLERIDLLLLDANIRGMDGVRVLRALRQKAPTLPAYLISGHDEPSVRRVFTGIPFDGFIPKPFTRNAIVAMLERIRTLPTDPGPDRAPD